MCNELKTQLSKQRMDVIYQLLTRIEFNCTDFYMNCLSQLQGLCCTNQSLILSSLEI